MIQPQSPAQTIDELTNKWRGLADGKERDRLTRRILNYGDTHNFSAEEIKGLTADLLRRRRNLRIQQALKPSAGRAGRIKRFTQQLLNLNAGLVRSEAKKYLKVCFDHGTITYDDLCQEGMVGLTKALDRFDLSLGNAFSSFALPKIRSELMHYRRDRLGTIRVPRGWVELRDKVERVQKDWRALGRDVPIEEIAVSEFGLTIERWEKIAACCLEQHHLILNASPRDGESELQISYEEDQGIESLIEAETLRLKDERVWSWGRYLLSSIQLTCFREYRENVEPKYIALRHGLTIAEVRAHIAESTNKLHSTLCPNTPDGKYANDNNPENRRTENRRGNAIARSDERASCQRTC